MGLPLPAVGLTAVPTFQEQNLGHEEHRLATAAGRLLPWYRRKTVKEKWPQFLTPKITSDKKAPRIFRHLFALPLIQ